MDLMDHPTTITEFAAAYNRQPTDLLDKGVNPDNLYVQRTVFCTADAAEALGLDWPQKNGLTSKALDRAVKSMTGWVPDREGKRYKRWGGVNTTWYAREDADPIDIQRGFVFADAPEHTEAEFADYGFTDDDLGPEYPDEDIDNLV